MASLINSCNAPAGALTLFNFECAVVCSLRLDGEPWFVAANPSQALFRLDNDERTLFTVKKDVSAVFRRFADECLRETTAYTSDPFIEACFKLTASAEGVAA